MEINYIQLGYTSIALPFIKIFKNEATTGFLSYIVQGTLGKIWNREQATLVSLYSKILLTENIF